MSKENVDKMAWRIAIANKTTEWKDFPNNLQNIHTPFDLCNCIISKLKEYSGEIKNLEFCVFNLEFVDVLIYDFDVLKEKIWFVTDCKEKAAICKSSRYNGVNVMKQDFFEMLEKKEEKTFDVVVYNPPYQTKSNDANTKTQAIWDKFVKKASSLCKENGHIAAIHPSGWRSCGKIFEDAKGIKEKQIEYLEIHDEQDGVKTFGVTTRYDWYVLKNCPISHATTIKDQNGALSKVNLKDISFIPNTMIDKVFSFLARHGEKRVEIIHSFSAYESRKSFMSETQHSGFIHPVIYSTPIEAPTIWYSSTNQNGHFGIPKLILNPSRPLGFVVDEKGDYGMSQFCVGIVGDAKHLQLVAGVIKNQKTNGFAEFMEACHFTDKIFNKDVISLLKKDFWKYFAS